MMKTCFIFAAAATSAAAIFYPASSAGLSYSGRYQVNADATLGFDWEGFQIHANLNGASYMEVVMNTSGPTTKIVTHIQNQGTQVAGGTMWIEASRLWVSPTAASNTYRVVQAISGNTTVRVFHELEPSFSGAAGGQYFTFVGINTDGALNPPTTKTRRIELVGDSISCGYGSLCTSGGPVTDWTSSNYGSYNQQLCDYFNANCSIVAWSGKGMYENCCDNGERMPQYYLQTRGGEQYSQTWDFSRFTPDALIINLGTNDFGHDSGPAWEANFTATYVQFVQNVSTIYYAGKYSSAAPLTVFAAQGPMNNSPNLYNALQAAIQQINSAPWNAAKSVKALFLDMRGPPNDGCGGHPGVAGHAGMFAMAKPVIAQAMGWD